MASRVRIRKVASDPVLRGSFPAVDVSIPPGLYARLPPKLRVADESMLSIALQDVVSDWWSLTPKQLIQEHLSPAFSGRLQAESSGRSNRWVVVYGLPPVSSWTVEQKRAWASFADALQRSIVEAERKFHRNIGERLKVHLERERARKIETRKAENARKLQEKEASKARKIKERREAEEALAQAADAARKAEWENLVQKGEDEFFHQKGISRTLLTPLDPLVAEARRYGEEKAALHVSVHGSAKPAIVQKHLKKLRTKKESGLLRALEVDSLSWAQAARIRLANTLRQKLQHAAPKERRAEAGVLRKSLGDQEAQKNLELAREEAFGKRFQGLELDEGIRPTAHGRYESPVSIPEPQPPVPVTLPREMVEALEEEARNRVLSELGPEPEPEPEQRGYNVVYAYSNVRDWNVRFRARYAQIRAELFAAAQAQRTAELEVEEMRAREREQCDSRFANLEID